MGAMKTAALPPPASPVAFRPYAILPETPIASPEETRAAIAEARAFLGGSTLARVARRVPIVEEDRGKRDRYVTVTESVAKVVAGLE